MTALRAPALRALLADRFGIRDALIERQPGGQDEHATVMQARSRADGTRWIVKIRRAGPRTRIAARTLEALEEAGIPHLVPARRPTRPGRPGGLDEGRSEALDGGGHGALELDGQAISVVPYLEASQAARVRLGADDWRRLGRFTSSLHAVRLPSDLRRRLRRDRYHPRELGLAERDDRAVVAGVIPATPWAREVAALWSDKRRTILDLVRRTRALGDRMRARRLPRVVTHGDLHTYNVLVDARHELWVVDWDELMLAPRERDLMFFVGGIAEQLVGPEATEAFLAGYDGPPVDPVALAYYRHAWAVQDIAGYAARVLLGRRRDEAGQREAAGILAGLFGPGEIVELAIASLRDVDMDGL